MVSYTPNLVLALASVINYNHKWRHNLERHLSCVYIGRV